LAVEPDPTNTALTDLFIGSAGPTSNDHVQVNPVGSSRRGSTGVKVQTVLNGVTTQTTYSQSFRTIYAFLQNGNDTVQLAPALTINAVVTAGNGNDSLALGDGNDTVTLGGGNDIVVAGDGLNTVTLGNGNDSLFLGNGSDVIVAGNGNDYVVAGDGNDTVMLGDGNENVLLGNGSDVIVEGDGHDTVVAGNGADLVIGGLGEHTILLGNGNDNLIDGSASLVNSGDSFRQILSDWNSSSSASVDTRLKLVYNTNHPNVLRAGSERDWFFFMYART
jgi:Ca2+-binding RTX toxin-like protein